MDLIGQTISHYRILEQLGAGGMGTVYKARDLKLDRLIALKFLRLELLADEASQQRFQQEARAVSALDHPNVAVIHAIEEARGQVFISMTYYEGQPLDAYLKDSAPLSLEEASTIARQIADGLHAAHQAGVVHRDIKPANVFLTKDGTAKILDFGLAKVQNPTLVTRTDQVVGTAAYMSPEQIQSEPVDARTDIFSLGVVLYEMLAGERPFKGEYAASVSYAIVNEAPLPLAEMRPDLPKPIQEIVGKSLAKEPESRYQSAEEFAAALSGRALPLSASGSAQPRWSLPRRWRRWMVFATAGILLALGGWLGWKRLGPDGAQRPVRVAVFPFSYEGKDDEYRWLGVGLAELIVRELPSADGLTVLDARKQARAAEQLGLRPLQMGLAEQTRIAAATRVSLFVSGRLQAEDGQVRAEAALYEASGRIRRRFDPVTGPVNRLQHAADQLAAQVLDVLDRAPTTAKEDEDFSLEVYRYYIEGRDAAADHRYVEAVAKLNRAVALDPAFADGYLWLAYTHNEIGETEEARAVLARGKPHVGKLREQQRLEFLCLEAQIDQRWQDYATYLKRLLMLDPDNAHDQFRYGWVQYKKFRRYDAGIAAMQKAVALDSNLSLAYNYLSYAYLGRGDAQSALAMADRYLASNPTNVNPLDTKAEILLLTGDYETSRRICARILDLDPTFVLAPLTYARAYAASGRFRQAHQILADYIARVSLSKYRALGLGVRAECDLLDNELGRALEEIDLALSLARNVARLHWVRGRILAASGRTRELAAQIATLDSLFADQGGLDGRPFWYHLKALASLAAGDGPGAIAELEQALRLYPADPSLFRTALADAWRAAGDLDSARVHYGRALAINPNNPRAAFGLAETELTLGNNRVAREAYARVLHVWADADRENELMRVARQKLNQIGMAGPAAPRGQKGSQNENVKAEISRKGGD